MADYEQTVSEFLRDGQYRIAELTIEIDQKKRDSIDWLEPALLRWELINWMNLLVDPRQDIKDGSNFLLSGSQPWTEREVIAECEYLRRKSGMNNIPWITFAGYSPVIRSEEGSGGTGLPSGNPGDTIIYDSSSVPRAVPFPQYTGNPNDVNIDEYFNRP